MARETFYHYAFDQPFGLLLRPLGVTSNDGVTVTDHQLHATFGRWRVDTPLTNIADAAPSGPYRWFKVIGLRGSMADRGITMGTTAAGGVCIRFHEPIPPVLGSKGHTALTVTVADPHALVEDLMHRGAIGADNTPTVPR